MMTLTSPSQKIFASLVHDVWCHGGHAGKPRVHMHFFTMCSLKSGLEPIHFNACVRKCHERVPSAILLSPPQKGHKGSVKGN